MKVLIINGVNLNMLGIREPKLYGNKTYADLIKYIKKESKLLGVKVKCKFSNSEGKICEFIQRAYKKYDGIVINPGAYTHTSIAISDALKAVNIPAVEVHISDIYNREDFRKVSYIKDCCKAQIVGKGFEGYIESIKCLKDI